MTLKRPLKNNTPDWSYPPPSATTPSFATIPGEVKRRVAAREKVLLILIDAFGLEFLPRHEHHPLVQRLDVDRLYSQFPSTTTAHIPTLAFGIPVEQHGWYEWNVYEPKLDRMIVPFRFAPSGSAEAETLVDQLPFKEFAPFPTFAQTLGAPSVSLMPAAYADSAFTRLCTQGSSVIPFLELADGVQKAMDWLTRADPDQGAYAYLYWDQVDATGHLQGPSSDAFRASAESALDACWSVLREPGAAGRTPPTVLFTADHGQVDVSPERVDYLDQLWPQLTQYLRFEHPAGSARDLFLHLTPGATQTVIDELSSRLPEGTIVKAAIGVFPNPGPRLRERMADVLILPAPGREAWLSTVPGPHQVFKGHHGGNTGAERGTYLAQLQR